MHMNQLFGESALMTTRQVAEKEGLTMRHVQLLCVQGHIIPARKIGHAWMIGRGYFFAVTLRSGKTKGTPLIVAERRGRGRPKGSRNKKAYPKGVKRPRKVNLV